MRAIAILAYTAAACSLPQEKYDPYGCHGEPLPTTAPSELTISGSLYDSVQNVSVGGASFQVTDNVGGQTQSTMVGDDGSFSFTVHTDGEPQTHFLSVSSQDGYAATNAYPAAPVAGDLNDFVVQMFLISELDEFGSNFGLENTTDLLVSVDDCREKALGGATVNQSDNTDQAIELYLSGESPGSGSETDGVTGSVIFLNLTPGSDTVAGTANSPVGSFGLYNHNVTITENALTQTVLALPGGFESQGRQ